MAQDEQSLDRANDLAAACTAPLFIQSRTLAGGHSAATPNGTATLIKFRQKTHVLTCRHVVQATNDGDDEYRTCALMGKHVVLNLSEVTAEGIASAFGTIPADPAAEEEDVAIALLPDQLWDLFVGQKPRQPIDLDAWREPPWPEIRWCAVAGYPTLHKTEDEKYVGAPLVVSVVEVVSYLGPDAKTFALSGELDQPSPYAFSGISGGPIFGLARGEAWPLGFVYEGHPSVPKASDISETGESFLKSSDLFFRGRILTPQTFGEWSRRRRPTPTKAIDWEALVKR